MSNKAYLTCCNALHLEPPHLEPESHSGECVILCADECLPLLWLGLFREADLQVTDLAVEYPGEVNGHLKTVKTTVEACAPLVTKDVALERLGESAQRFEEVLQQRGAFGGYVVALRDYIVSRPGEYVSVMLRELTGELTVEEIPGYYDEVRRALKYSGGDSVPNARATLVRLSTVMAERRFLPPTGLTKRNDVEAEDVFNMFRVMGYGWYVPVPWDQW